MHGSNRMIKTWGLLALALLLLAGCGGNDGTGGGETVPNDTNGDAQADQQPDQQPDAVTTASLVNSEEGFREAISEQGTWIIAILNDLELEGEAVVEGNFHNRNNPEDELYRKLALYAQDDNREITAQFTLTVPQLTIRSENFRIQGGTVKGDVLVEANGFNLHETAKIDGSLLFASEEVQNSASIDGEVTGETTVQQQEQEEGEQG